MALFKINFYALTLHQSTDVMVIMPDGLNENDEVPVLYLLHGYSDDYSMWERRTSIERYVLGKKLCVVMPSGHTSWYCNTSMADFFDYISTELPQKMHQFFPYLSQKREHTFIAGLSMGGYGATKCALTYPDRYAFVGALSAAYDLETRIKNGEKYMEMLGGLEKFKGSVDDLFATAESLDPAKAPKMYLCCGRQDECVLEDNIRFEKLLGTLGYDFEFVWDEGRHSWDYWDKHIQEVLKRII